MMHDAVTRKHVPQTIFEILPGGSCSCFLPVCLEIAGRGGVPSIKRGLLLPFDSVLCGGWRGIGLCYGLLQLVSGTGLRTRTRRRRCWTNLSVRLTSSVLVPEGFSVGSAFGASELRPTHVKAAFCPEHRDTLIRELIVLVNALLAGAVPDV
eukprot:1251649-Amphidinium_carterae.1